MQSPLALSGATPIDSVSSHDFYLKLNEIRVAEGGTSIRHTDFIDRVIDECDDLGEPVTIPHPQNNQPLKVYRLDYDQMMLVGMRESKSVRKKVLAWIKSIKSDSPERPKLQYVSMVNATEKIKQYKALGEEIAGMKESAIGVLEALGIEVIEKEAPKPKINREEIIKSLVSRTGESGYSGVYHHRNDEWMIRFARDKVVYYGGAGMNKEEAIQKRIEMEIMLKAGADMSEYVIRG